MLFVHVTYKFSSTQERDGFYNAACELKLTEECENEDGCLMYRYYMPCDTDKELFLLEKWESPEAQKIHCEQPHMVKLREYKEKFNAQTQVEFI